MRDTLDTTSYWHATARAPEFPELKENLTAQVLIIGGGITGVTCAFALARAGADAVLIEAGELCSGTTGRCTGKATIQHGAVYSRLGRAQGESAAALYAEAQRKALDFIQNIAREDPLSCGYAEADSHLYACGDELLAAVEAEHRAAQDLRIDCRLIRSPGFPPENRMSLVFGGQAVLHPVRYVSQLARKAQQQGARFFCHTRAVRIKRGETVEVECESGVIIRCAHLIMATQFPLYEHTGMFYTRLYPRRSYVVAVRAGQPWPDGSYYTPGPPVRSLRAHLEGGERILIAAGDGHVTARGGNMQEHFDALMQFAAVSAGLDDLIARWSAQDYETPDGLPYIGRLAKHSNLYVACGFAKWGITTGTLAGLMLPDLILGAGSPYEELFSPGRRSLRTAGSSVLAEVGGQIREYVRSKFEETDSVLELSPGQGRIIPYQGKRAGAYMDDSGRLTVVDLTCTHFGCELNWNDAEHSWDCPCHGGRYTYDGRPLEGPGTHPLKLLYQDPV